jgi:hypothetical protein
MKFTAVIISVFALAVGTSALAAPEPSAAPSLEDIKAAERAIKRAAAVNCNGQNCPNSCCSVPIWTGNLAYYCC